MPPPQNDGDLVHTVDKLRADLAKQKRRLDKAARKESKLETLLLSSEGDIEALHARLAACQLEHDQQRTQSHKFNAALKQQYEALLNELKQSNAQLRSTLEQRPSKKQFQTLHNALQQKTQQLEALSKQSDDASTIAQTHSMRLKQKDVLLLEARQQLAACEQQLSQYEKQLAGAVAQSNDETRHFEALFAEKDSLFDELKEKLSNTEAEQKALQNKLQHTINELEARPSVQEYKSLEADLMNKANDLRIVRQDLAMLRTRTESLEEKCDLEMKLSKEKDNQIQDSSAALEKMCQDISQISGEAESLRCKGQQQASQIEEQQDSIEKSKELLAKAESQADSMKLEFEKSSQAFRTERDGLVAKLEEARALINERPDAQMHQHVVSELEKKHATVEQLQRELAKIQETVDASKQTSAQQAALIREKDSSIESMKQQLSQANDQMMAMRSQFESQLNVHQAEKTEISSRLQMMDEQLNKRPKEEEYLQLKSVLEQNMVARNVLHAEKDKLHRELNMLRATCEKQQVELNEKQSLLVEAKSELVACENQISAQDSRHAEDLRRVDDTLTEKDAFISELKSQLQNHQENLSTTTVAFENEREQMQMSLSETREKASLELRKFQESREQMTAELGLLKTQVEDAVAGREQTKKNLQVAEAAISLKDSALASLRSSEEKLRKENEGLSRQATKLEHKLRESGKLIDEATEASKLVVQVQNRTHETEVAKLRAEISGTKSERDISVTLLRRVVQRVVQACRSCIDNDAIPSIEIDANKSVSELQILANNMIVSIEEHLRNGLQLQSEVQQLESREDNMKKAVLSLEAEKEDLENVISEARKAETEKNSTIQTLTKKANDLEKLAVSYKLFSEESELRLQSQEEAAEVTLTSLADELKMKEDDCEQLRAASKFSEAKVDELSVRLKEKENLEVQMNEMQHEHTEKLKDAARQRERLECEKTQLTDKLQQSLRDIAEGQSSRQTLNETQAELQSKCDSLETERISLLEARSSMESRNQELEKEMQEATWRIQNLTTTLEEKASLQSEALASRDLHRQELEALRIELANKTESTSALDAKLSESSKGLEVLREALNQSDEKLMRSQENLNLQSSQLDAAAKEILELHSSLQSITEDKCALEEGARKLQKEIEVSRMERDEAASQVVELKGSLESVTVLNNSLRDSVQRLETEIDELRAMNRGQKEALSTLDGVLKSKEAVIGNISTKEAELIDKVSSLELDIRNSALLFEEEKESLRETLLQETITEKTRMKEEFTERFQKAAEEAEKAGHQLRAEISLLEERLSSQAAVLATDRDELRSELAQKTAALSDVREKLHAAIEEHQSVTERKEKLENELEGERQVLNEKQTTIQELKSSLQEKDIELQGSNQRCEAAFKSIGGLESELSQAQASLVASQSRSRDEQSTIEEKLREADEKISVLEKALRDAEDASAKRLAETERLNSTRIMSLEEESQNRQREVDRLVEVETRLRAETTTLTNRLHGTERSRDDIVKFLRECEDLATKRLAEIERLNMDIIPSLKEISDANQKEVVRLSAVLDSRNEEWDTANAFAVAEHEGTLRELEEMRQKLLQSEQIVVEREAVNEQLRTAQEEAMAQLEQTRAKMDDIVRLRSADADHLQEQIEMYRQKSSEYEVRLQRKGTELVEFEARLGEAREKCALLQKENERISLSVEESQDSHRELSEIQRVHEKLLAKVTKLQRRARRAEMLLQHEKKKHAVISKKLEVESKRQVSPSTKGLSPAMKRPRAHSLRPPLSPRDGNSKPPMMPKSHHARRSLDFGA